MSMLDRYRKPGGFLQLLALIETCQSPKQEKLLDIIAQEDMRWAQTVRSKMLSIERIYSWGDEALAEIFGSLQDLTVAVALHSASPEFKIRIIGFFSHGRVRKIEDLISTKGPSAAEVMTTHMKIVESVRKMGSDGYLRFEKVDLELVIDDNIDDHLLHPALPGEIAAIKSAPRAIVHDASTRLLHSYSTLNEHQTIKADQSETTPANVNQASNESRLMEIQGLKKRVADLSKETALLRHDLSIAKSKLDQIKKIA